MPRVTTVKSARRDHRGSCGHDIKKGEGYRWFKRKTGPASGYQVKHCLQCPFKPSQLEANQYLSEFMAAEEGFSDSPGDTPEEIGDALTEVAEVARQNSETMEENAQAMVDGFGHETSMTEELEDRAREWSDFADAIEQAADEIRNEEAKCSSCEQDEGSHPVDEDDLIPCEEFDLDRDALIETAESALGEVPF